MDRKRIELFPKACKAPVLPLSPTAHIYKDLTPIYSVRQIKNNLDFKNQPYPIWVRFVRVRHTGVYRVPHAVGVNPQHAHCFIPDTLAVLWAYLTHRLLAEHSRWLLFRT